MKRVDGDEGAAAVEFGVLLLLMVIIAAFLFPLGEAFYDKIRLGRAAGDAMRFASATPNTPAYGSSGRRPSADDVANEAVRAYDAAGGSGLTTSDVIVTTATQPGQPVTVRITKTVDLGPMGSVLSILHIHSARVTVTVDASGREE